MRAALTAKEGTGFSWYAEPLINTWLKDKPKWAALCWWAEKFCALPRFELDTAPSIPVIERDLDSVQCGR